MILCRSLAEVIETHFGVRYHPRHVWRVLRADGLEQSEAGAEGPRGRRRSDRALASRGLAAHEKNATRSGRSIVFVDESGFMLQPTVQRTWAPRGQTPLHKSWDRRDRLSVLSALTLAPRRKRLGLYFDIHTHNITTD